MIWYITFDFVRGPSFGPLLVHADSRDEAIEGAKAVALELGFDQPVKRVTAVQK